MLVAGPPAFQIEMLVGGAEGSGPDRDGVGARKVRGGEEGDGREGGREGGREEGSDGGGRRREDGGTGRSTGRGWTHGKEGRTAAFE